MTEYIKHCICGANFAFIVGKCPFCGSREGLMIEAQAWERDAIARWKSKRKEAAA